MWAVEDNRLILKTEHTQIFPTSSEIVGLKYKGRPITLNDETISTSPDKEINNLTINRFPLAVRLTVCFPRKGTGDLSIGITAVSKNQLIPFDDPKRDQIIINNNWFPLEKDSMDEIKQILNTSCVTDFTQPTLKQCLQIIKLNSDLVDINTESIPVEAKESRMETFNPEIVNATLYEYQSVGAKWLINVLKEDVGCILADEMGLGKTLQIITVLSHFAQKWDRSFLVVSPATLLENWKREVNKFAPSLSVYIHAGARRTGFPAKLKEYDLVVTSYDTAIRDLSLFNMIKWSIVVLDEAQAIKNPDAKRTTSVKHINKRASIAVTGTPIENRLTDLWSIMDFCFEGYLGNKYSFESMYDNTTEDAMKLEQIISPLILRRRVTDVAKDLPEKIIIPANH